MRELITIIIESFYQKAINDVLIGYHFARFRDPEVLAPHLERLAGFWEIQLTGTATKPILGKPFQLLFTHLELHLKPGEMGRWIVLFHQTLEEFTAHFKTAEEIEVVQAMSEEWKKRIQFFKGRFESHPEMFKTP